MFITKCWGPADLLRCIVYNEVPTNEMKTSYYPKHNNFFAALKQMKYVCLSFNRLYIIPCFMFDFHKTGFIV